MFAIQTDREWRRFCAEVMGAPTLADDARFSTNALRVEHRVALEAMIEQEFAGRTRATLLAVLSSADIPTGAVNTVADVAAHPQLKARGRWAHVASPGGDIQALIPPHNISSVVPRMGAVPTLGEHTAQVLTEITQPVTRSPGRS
jgi:crotonobetainyl-CoA:carnitine CoA-transferase CaiB-like acyl-CoA transferase